MTDKLFGKAYAKINLTLDVVGKRDDGYHYIESVMQSISLCDNITLCKTDRKDIVIECSDLKVPCDKRNTVYKACVKFFDFTGIENTGVKIIIEKNIPSEAGLGGGSSDAAVVIKLLDRMFDTGLSLNNMIEIGAQVGADVPFCIVSGTALCTGLGEIVTPLPKLREYYILLVKPNFGISTPLAYKAFDEKNLISLSSTKAMVDAITCGNDITKLLSNDLESAVDNAEISKIKNILTQLGAKGTLMTGSGSCVYGIFEDKFMAYTAYQVIKNDFPFVSVEKTI